MEKFYNTDYARKSVCSEVTRLTRILSSRDPCNLDDHDFAQIIGFLILFRSAIEDEIVCDDFVIVGADQLE